MPVKSTMLNDMKIKDNNASYSPDFNYAFKYYALQFYVMFSVEPWWFIWNRNDFWNLYAKPRTRLCNSCAVFRSLEYVDTANIAIESGKFEQAYWNDFSRTKPTAYHNHSNLKPWICEDIDKQLHRLLTSWFNVR